MRFRSLLVLFACLALLPFQAHVNAQVLYGSIVGQVNDPSGAAVPNVTVTITDKATGQSRSTTTDSGGRYAFTDVPQGNYDAKYEGKGFRTLEKTGISV